MADDKQFPPSELRLERLREQGVVPFSRELSSAVVFLVLAAVMLLALALVRRESIAIFRFVARYWTVAPASSGGTHAFVEQFVALSITIAALVFVGVLLGGLLQNRFLWAPKALGRRGSLWNFNLFNGLTARIVRLGLAGLAAFISVAAALASGADWFASINAPTTAAVALDVTAATREIAEMRLFSFWSFLQRMIGMGVIGLLLWGVLAKLYVVYNFRQMHRMTRAEVEAELRETEPSPELRARRRTEAE